MTKSTKFGLICFGFVFIFHIGKYFTGREYAKEFIYTAIEESGGKIKDGELQFHSRRETYNCATLIFRWHMIVIEKKNDLKEHSFWYYATGQAAAMDGINNIIETRGQTIYKLAIQDPLLQDDFSDEEEPVKIYEL